jgi:hypothetical protein
MLDRLMFQRSAALRYPPLATLHHRAAEPGQFAFARQPLRSGCVLSS